MTYAVNSEVCQENLLFQTECFLIVDHVQDEDSGEYTINVTSYSFDTVGATASITGSVNVTVGMYAYACNTSIMHILTTRC